MPGPIYEQANAQINLRWYQRFGKYKVTHHWATTVAFGRQGPLSGDYIIGVPPLPLQLSPTFSIPQNPGKTQVSPVLPLVAALQHY